MINFNPKNYSLSSIEEERPVNIGGVKVKDCTVRFLNAVMDPFKTVDAARVPDLQKQSSICMRDYVDDVVPVVTDNDSPANDVTGLFLYWHYGYNSLTANDSTFNDAYWHLSYNAIPVTDEALYVDNWLDANLVNRQAIYTSSSGSPSQAGLANAFRVFAGGIKVLPTIETITSDSTLAIRNFWGGLCTPADLENIQSSYLMKDCATVDEKKEEKLGATASGTSIYEVVRNWDNVQEFPNATGVTVRYDPFQFEEQLDYVNFTQAIPSSTSMEPQTFQNTDNIAFPFVLVRFTSQTSSGGIAPLRFFGTWWLESTLVEPTPIFCKKSPVDVNFGRIRSLVSDTDKYPVVTKGHSFHSFVEQSGTFLKDVQILSNELTPVRKVFQHMAKQQKKKKKKRKRRKRRKAMQRRNMNPTQRGQRLPGVTRDGLITNATRGPNL